METLKELLPSSGGSFLIFMLFFIGAAAVLSGVIALVVWALRSIMRRSYENRSDRRRRREDERLLAGGFNRTLTVSDTLSFDEENGTFRCIFPYSGSVVTSILPISCITDYRLERAAAFAGGYLLTFTFVDEEAVRKVTHIANVEDYEICIRLDELLKHRFDGSQEE